MEILGIDVGKHEMHAVLLQNDRATSKSVSNSAAGFKQLQSWLRNRKAERVHACLEATGGWSEDLALALHEAGHVVSLVNPMRIKALEVTLAPHDSNARAAFAPITVKM